MADWNVSKIEGFCCVSGRRLVEGEDIYCVLVETPEGFERRDYAAEHWSEPPEDAFCFWKSKVPSREQKKRTFVDDEVLINFFTRLADETDPVKENFRFVLALILMRKRILKYEGTERAGGEEVWTMRLAKVQSRHRVRNPHLDDEKIGEVSVQLGQILHSDMGDFAELDELDRSDDAETGADHG